MVEPRFERSRREDVRELAGERSLILLVLPVGEVGASEELAETLEELRLERADGEVAPVGGRVDPVARETTGQQGPARARRRGDAQSGRAERCVMETTTRGPIPVRARSRSAARIFVDGAERAGSEIGDLDRREPRGRVFEYAGPPEIVDVVPGAEAMSRVITEARDRAVDGGLGDAVRPDAEPRGDSRPESLQHDVGSCAKRLRERRIGWKVALDGFAACSKRCVPGCGRGPHWIPAGRLDTNDSGAESTELAAGVGARQVTREVDDQRVGQRLHVG